MKSWRSFSRVTLALMLAAAVVPAGCRKKKKDPFAEAERSQPAPPPMLNADPTPEPVTWEEKWNAAKSAADIKDAPTAEKYWTMIVAEADAFAADDPRQPQVPVVINEAAYYYYFNGGMDKAEVLFKKLVDLRTKTEGPDAIEVSTELLKLGNLCGFNSRYEEAEAYYKRALEIVEKNPTHEKYKEYKKRTLNDYATTLQKIEGRAAEAQALTAQAAAVQ